MGGQSVLSAALFRFSRVGRQAVVTTKFQFRRFTPQKKIPIIPSEENSYHLIPIIYTQRAYELVYRPLSASEREDLYVTFRRVGEGLQISQLPANCAHWQQDRKEHLRRDLIYSDYTALLYQQYRRHLGFWRYQVLLRLQALLVPDEVRRLLGLKRARLLAGLVDAYGLVERLNLQVMVRRVLIEPRYWSQIEQLERAAA